MKICPYCEAEIANNAKKCKYCGEIVVEEKEVRQCPYCEAELSETAKKCKYCGEWVDEKSPNKKVYDSINSHNSENWFSWRINRKNFFVVCLVILIIQWIISYMLGQSAPEDPSRFAIFLSFGGFLFLAPFPRRIKRFHDIWSSWWTCLWYLLIPLYGIFDLYLIFVPWQKWENKYWKEPN